MASFGETLKRERELRKISLREVSEATKIGLRYLEALENNRFDQLPGGLFNKGFIRAYAKFIGLDAESLVNAYLFDIKHEKESEPAPPRFTGLRFEEHPAQEAAALPGKPLWARPGLRIPLAVLGGLGLVAGIWWISSRVPAREPQDEPSPRPISRAAAGEMAGPTSTQENSPENPLLPGTLASEGASTDSSVEKSAGTLPAQESDGLTEADPKAAMATSAGNDGLAPEPEAASGTQEMKPVTRPGADSSEPVKLEQELKPAVVPAPIETERAPRVRVEEKVQGSTQVSDEPLAPPGESAVAKPAEIPTVPAEPTSGGPPLKPMVLTVSTGVPATIQLSCDGKVRFDGKLPSGGYLPILCTDDIKLSTTNAGATSLNIDGRSCLPLGKKGHPLRDFSLDRSRVEEFCPTPARR